MSPRCSSTSFSATAFVSVYVLGRRCCLSSSGVNDSSSSSDSVLQQRTLLVSWLTSYRLQSLHHYYVTMNILNTLAATYEISRTSWVSRSSHKCVNSQSMAMMPINNLCSTAFLVLTQTNMCIDLTYITVYQHTHTLTSTSNWSTNAS